MAAALAWDGASSAVAQSLAQLPRLVLLQHWAAPRWSAALLLAPTQQVHLLSWGSQGRSEAVQTTFLHLCSLEGPSLCYFLQSRLLLALPALEGLCIGHAQPVLTSELALAIAPG